MLTNAIANPLKSIPCFAGLAAEGSEQVARSLVEKSYARGETIFLEGDPCPGLFVVRSGGVKLYRVSRDGAEQIVRMVGVGGCFECAPLFDRGPNPASAQALRDTALYLLPAAAFQELLRAHPELILGFTRVMAIRLRSLLDKVEDFSFRKVSSRLAKLLLQLGEQEGETLVVSPSQPLKQHDLACTLGCSRQAVNSALQALSREGIVKVEKGRIFILKPKALVRITD